MIVPAPGRFSTDTGWPSERVSSLAAVRENVSVAPPGGNDTINRIGFDG
jgi:hypothetical protein